VAAEDIHQLESEPRALSQPDALNPGCAHISDTVSFKCSSGRFTAAMVLVAKLM